MGAIADPAFLVCAGAVLAGAFIQGTGGLGFAMFAAPVALSLAMPRLRATAVTLSIAGFGSGLMGTITSVGAPPMGLVMQNEMPAKVRATIGAFLMVGAIVSIAVLAWADRFGTREAALGALLLLPMALGFRLSTTMVKRVDARAVRRLVLAVSAISALIILAQNL